MSVILTPDGVMVEEIKDGKSIKSLIKDDVNIVKNLRSFCQIDPDTILKDIINLVSNSKVLETFLGMYSWCNNIKEYNKEANKNPILNENSEVDYLEISWHVTWDKEKDGFYLFKEPEFLGIGFPLKEEKYDLPKGYVAKYAIEFTPLNELAHLKVKLNTQFTSKRNFKNAPTLKGSCDFTLLEVLDAIYWEISFLGSIEERDNSANELKSIIEDIKEEHYPENKRYDSVKDMLEDTLDLDQDWKDFLESLEDGEK